MERVCLVASLVVQAKTCSEGNCLKCWEEQSTSSLGIASLETLFLQSPSFAVVITENSVTFLHEILVSPVCSVIYKDTLIFFESLYCSLLPGGFPLTCCIFCNPVPASLHIHSMVWTDLMLSCLRAFHSFLLGALFLPFPMALGGHSPSLRDP